MSQEEGKFQFPRLFLGCEVEVSGDPAWSDTSFGIVGRVKGGSANSADIIVYHRNSGKTYLRRDCWHEDDPRVVALAHVFQDGDRGVFRLAEGEVQRRKVMARLDGLESMLETIVEDIALLKRVNPSRDPGPGPKRKRRSPPARQTEPAGV